MTDDQKTSNLHLVKSAEVRPGTLEQKGVTSIVPVRAAILALHAPTTQEWPVPDRPGELWLAFSPDQARVIGIALLNVAQELDSDRH